MSRYVMLHTVEKHVLLGNHIRVLYGKADIWRTNQIRFFVWVYILFKCTTFKINVYSKTVKVFCSRNVVCFYKAFSRSDKVWHLRFWYLPTLSLFLQILKENCLLSWGNITCISYFLRMHSVLRLFFRVSLLLCIPGHVHILWIIIKELIQCNIHLYRLMALWIIS